MIALKISSKRPERLQAVLDARSRELDRPEPRVQILEFVTWCLLLELCGERLANPPHRDAFLFGLTILDREFRQPKILRELVLLAREGAHP